MTAPLRAKKSNNLIVWILLGLLIISLTGFGVQSVGSGGSQAVGAVGDEKITVDTYVRALNSQIREMSRRFNQNITLEQAMMLGVDQQVMAQVLATATLDGENSRIGLSVGDERVRQSLLETEAFHSVLGKFDTVAYNAALDQAGLKPGEYDEIIRTDTSRAILQTAVVSGIQANDSYALALLDFIGEGRNFEWATVDQALLAEPTRAPSEAEIEAHYKANPDNYTSLQARKITYAYLTPDMLVDQIETDEAELKASYESQPDRFNTPPRRIVDRVVFSSVADAQAALDQITGGEKTFEDIVTGRNLTLQDVDMGEVSRTDLSTDAAEALFTMSEPGLAGPVTSSLGPAIFRVNAVLEGRSTSFEDARADLHTEQVADRARREIEDSVGDVDDLLAGGAVLEELAAETDLKLSTIDFTADSEGGIAAYTEFREAATAVTKEDFPEILMLSDGGIFALRLDDIVEPALLPLAEVKNQVSQDWAAAETRKRVLELAANTAALLENGDTFQTQALTPATELDIRRDGLIENAPAELVSEVFKMKQGEIKVVSDANVVAIVRLNEIVPFDESSEENAPLLQSVSQQYSRLIGVDVFEAFTNALQDEAGITLNQALINAIHTQIP